MVQDQQQEEAQVLEATLAVAAVAAVETPAASAVAAVEILAASAVAWFPVAAAMIWLVLFHPFN